MGVVNCMGGIQCIQGVYIIALGVMKRIEVYHECIGPIISVLVDAHRIGGYYNFCVGLSRVH